MRVLRILTRANVGGPARQALALFDRDKEVGVQTLLAIGACAPHETEVELGDRPILASQGLDSSSRGLVRVARLGRAARPWRDALAIRELRRIIRAFQPDVVHTHTSQAGLFGRRAAFAERVPVVAHTFHGHVMRDYYPRPVNFLLRRMEARLASRTNLLFAVSDSCRAELEAMGVARGRVEVLPPAIELGPFSASDRDSARQRMGLNAEFAVGFAGRLVSIKRPELFAELVAALPDVRGCVLGDGPATSVFEGIENLSRFGAVRRPELYLAGLDALVLTSRREGLPLVAAEAMAAGVPVLGFDVPGVRDALSDWGAGILVAETEGVEGLVNAVRKLRDDSHLAPSLKARGRVGLARYDPAATARRLAECYHALRFGTVEIPEACPRATDERS